MRMIALPIVALTLGGAHISAEPATSDEPSSSKSDPAPDRAECSDRIEHARAATGQPPLLRRGPATPEKPILIYAVDRRQDGCAVMVAKGDPGDIRPLPEVKETGKLLWRVKPSQ